MYVSVCVCHFLSQEWKIQKVVQILGNLWHTQLAVTGSAPICGLSLSARQFNSCLSRRAPICGLSLSARQFNSCLPRREEKRRELAVLQSAAWASAPDSLTAVCPEEKRTGSAPICGLSLSARQFNSCLPRREEKRREENWQCCI